MGNIESMLLKTYLKESGDTAVTLAERVGVSPGAIHKYAYFQREPSIAIAEKIEQETRGMVSITDLARPAKQDVPSPFAKPTTAPARTTPEKPVRNIPDGSASSSTSLPKRSTASGNGSGEKRAA